MSLINCPECNKEISDNCRRCINCGAKIKRNNKKVLIMLIIIFTFILILSLSVLILINVKNKNTAQNIEYRISQILNGSIDDANEIIDIKNSYTMLNKNIKKYISNRQDFENYKIDINEDNFLKYFDVKVSMSNYDYKSTGANILGFSNYRGTCDMSVTIQPKSTYKCNNVKVDLNMGIFEWKNGYISNAKLDINGNYNETKQLVYETTLVAPFEPTYYENSLTIIKASGNISFN